MTTQLALNVLNQPPLSQSPTIDALHKLHSFLSAQADANSDEALLWIQARDVCVVLGERVCAEHDALENLVERCDGAEGVRADGSNIDTLAAHIALDGPRNTDQ